MVRVGGWHSRRNRRGLIHGSITSPVRVRPLGEISQLVRFIVMAEFENGGARYISDSNRRINIGGHVVGIIPKLLHKGLVNRLRVNRQNIS